MRSDVNVGAGTAHERFYKMLDDELDKIGAFTAKTVTAIRDRLEKLTVRVERETQRAGDVGLPKDSSIYIDLDAQARKIGDDYLAMEKFVNVNYMGFHKILKKHDKNVPQTPIRQFYISRVHHQPWVQGNFSDVLVRLSNIHSLLRHDASGQKNEDAAQVGRSNIPPQLSFSLVLLWSPEHSLL